MHSSINVRQMKVSYSTHHSVQFVAGILKSVDKESADIHVTSEMQFVVALIKIIL